MMTATDGEGKMALTLGWSMARQVNQDHGVQQERKDSAEGSRGKELNRILSEGLIRTVFQPIVALADGEIIGYEALSRGPVGSMLERPDQLFSTAEACRKVWELDYLCRTAALDRAQGAIGDKVLFVNVDPNIIKDERFRKGHTRDLLRRFDLRDGQLVFEITERSAISDYRGFRKVLDHYTEQGYKIAIDDAGAGHSGLRMLAETRPQFVKIDMELVRDIDNDSLKRSLMKAFYEFALTTNIRIIAEGIETREELHTLIDIGVHYGQGYYLQPPAAQFLDIAEGVKEEIMVRNERKRAESFQTPLTMPIGELCRQDQAFPTTLTGLQITEMFHKYQKLMGIPIVEEGKPVGLVMRDCLFAQLATQYGVAVYMNRPIQLLMDKNPLVVDYHTPLEQVTEFALAREEARLYDYILVTKESRYHGITTVKDLLSKTTQLEINRAKHCNPLTGLPGNLMIEETLQRVLQTGQPYAVLYLDLDNFKAYNDVYGFENGDKILGATAQILQEKVGRSGEDNFVGHIGGDDFVAVMRDGDVVAVCNQIIQEFDQRIRGYYNERDLAAGCILANNRHGVEEKYPLVSISVAVVVDREKKIRNTVELAEKAAALKKKCKMQWSSCYVLG